MSENKGLTCLGLLGFLILQIVLGSIISGYVLVKLWMWFAVPTFGLQPLTLVPAIGVGILISYLTHHSIPQEEGREMSKVITDASTETFLYPLIVLSIGWLVSLFM